MVVTRSKHKKTNTPQPNSSPPPEDTIPKEIKKTRRKKNITITLSPSPQPVEATKRSLRSAKSPITKTIPKKEESDDDDSSDEESSEGEDSADLQDSEDLDEPSEEDLAFIVDSSEDEESSPKVIKAVNKWMDNLSPKEKNKNQQLYSKIAEVYKPFEPAKILNSSLSDDNKIKALELYNSLSAFPKGSTPFNMLKAEIDKFIKENSTTESSLLEQTEKDIKNHLKSQGNDIRDLKVKILENKASLEIKARMYADWESFEDSEDGKMAADLKKRLTYVTNFPWNIYRPYKVSQLSCQAEKDRYLLSVKTTLDQTVSFMDETVDSIYNHIANFIRNKNTMMRPILLYGVPGVSKTTIAKKGIAQALGLPFEHMKIGGMKSVEPIIGQDSTWIGSHPGMIYNAVCRLGCLNGVIALDEIDKCSKEIQDALNHLLDESNESFKDDYFGNYYYFDLSRILFIGICNDIRAVPSYLLDRFHKIKVDAVNNKQKVVICQRHIIPDLLKNAGFETGDITVLNETIDFLIVKADIKNEEGARNIRHILEAIIARINTLLQDPNNVLKTTYWTKLTLPLTLTPQLANKLYKNVMEKDSAPPAGMYM